MIFIKVILCGVALIAVVVGQHQSIEEASFDEIEVDHEHEKRTFSGNTGTLFRNSYGGVKSVKGGRRKSGGFDGCPPIPQNLPNGFIKCTTYSGCRATCSRGYKFPDGAPSLMIVCRDKRLYFGPTWSSLPHCEPVCIPRCHNNGICVAPNECNCPENFSGLFCQNENKLCLNSPPLPRNSQRHCRSGACTISCIRDHVFPDGSSITNLICKNGNWEPSRADWTSVPDCEPVCKPPCQNGGNCLALNTCQCPQDFRGPQCQYSAYACSVAKLGFNGGYKCTGNGDTFACTLSCPEGGQFEFSPAPVYTCTYDTGVFQPQPIPQCQIPNNHIENTDRNFHHIFTKITNHSYSASDIFGTSSKYHSLVGELKYGILKSYTVEDSTDAKTTISSDAKSQYEMIQLGEARRSETLNISANTGDNQVIKPKLPEPKVCFTWGGVHYKTFDGKIVSFESECTHILVQDVRDGTFTIATSNSPGCKTGGSCFRIVKIFVQGRQYVLSQNDDGLPEFRSARKTLPVPSRLAGLHVVMTGQFLVVSLDLIGATVKWDGAMLVQIEASESLWNRTVGLCGTMDGDDTNDLVDKDRGHPKNVATLARGWQVQNIGETCDENPSSEHSCTWKNELFAQEALQFCSELLNNPKFATCSTVMDLSLLESTCTWDYCACKDYDKRKCACDTMSVYVRECARKGIVALTGWRDKDVCPIQCTGGRVYAPCGPTTQPSCGTDVDTNTSEVQLAINCEEGCFCPRGFALHEGKCVSPEECPCSLRSKFFKPGSSIPKDCNTCTCSAGKWICTQIQCAARCAAIGDPHYVTFDGKHYNFMGKCSYYLLKSNNYSIEAENVACPGAISEGMGFSTSNDPNGPSCTKTVTIRLNDMSIKLKQNRQILINGEEVNKLPLLAGDAKIRITSSIFLVVLLPNGIEIWWDGVSRVYVNVPAEFRGKTKGLCGTFTVNQKDDFLTPDGDVEQVVFPFANKWKTSEQCEDVLQKDANHPCDINPQKRATAEKACRMLKSDLFSSCHWYVDPERFHEDCMYDMCACETDVKSCLCPILAAYAMECSHLGVKIPWRQEVDECRVHCPSGQVYQICGNSCTRSCADISFHRDCRSQCVEGCNCPEGQTLDVTGECIPIGQCPCEHAGLEFSAGHREVRPGTKSRELCTCAGGIWNCRPATKDEIRDFPSALDLKSVCSAAKNQEITTCEPVQPQTCRNMHEPMTQSPAICRPSCVCKKGYVLDAPSGQCVKREDCPCYHGGKSYKEGSTIEEECNKCKCTSGKWECTDATCAGVCTAWGDSHYETFDGKLYDFQGVCDYVLAKGSLSKDETFDIFTQNVPCGTTGVTCSKSITVSVGEGASRETITLTRGKEMPKGKFKRFAVRKAGLFVFLDVPDLGLVLQWDEGTRVYIRLDPKWKGRTKGLCGDYNGNGEDDFKTPSDGMFEASANLFGDSWRKESYCSVSKDIVDTCNMNPERRVWATEKCGVLKSSVFESCHSEVDVDPYLKRCVFDTCGCDLGGDCECLCTVLAAYAQECNARGVPIKWRSQKLCPIQCDERCSTYSPCISTCPQETCDNLATHGDTLHLCTGDSCVEGCLPKPCPEGLVYRNTSYLECVPKATCKPLCMEIDGITYFEGDKVKGDDCQTCFCSRGKIVCKGEECSHETTLSPTVPMDSYHKCIDGWTTWLNRDKPVEEKKYTDIEPLPNSIDLQSINGSGVCSRDDIVDIKCRSVKRQLTPKESGLNVECSLERGLYCHQHLNEPPCIDFEISVLCRCKSQSSPVTESPVVKSTTEITFPTSIIEETMTTRICKQNEEWDECATQCDRVCTYYGYVLRQEGLCGNGSNCISGCVPIDRPSCPLHKLWRDSRTCVDVNDCSCKSHDGKAVKPGAVILESECEKCQCLSDHYICDKSLCLTTITPVTNTRTTPSTEMKSTIIIPTTVSPPKSCDEEDFVLLTGNTSPASFSTSSWEPSNSTDVEEWIAIEFPKPEAIYGVDVRGNPAEDEYVTSYRILFSENGLTFSYILDDKRQPKLFRGPVDATKPVRQIFDEPIEAKVVRINPRTWHNGISLRAELIGCGEHLSTIVESHDIHLNTKNYSSLEKVSIEKTFDVITEAPRITDIVTEAETQKITVYSEKPVHPVCNDKMGVGDGILADDQIAASSTIGNLVPDIRSLSPGVWHPKLDSPNQYVQFDFSEPRNLTGIETAGGDDTWTTAYKVFYSIDRNYWNPVIDDREGTEKVFLANFDDITPKVNYFEKPLHARFLRVQPIKWHNHIGLKAEVYGCFTPYQHTTTPTIFVEVKPTPTTEVPVSQFKCNVCDGIPKGIDRPCKCDEPYFWDGISCITKSECPCVVGHIPYSVGSFYEKEDCQQCLCALNGTAVCHPKKCEPCKDPELQAVVTPLCHCVCKPCPAGTRICPTSNVCINETSWCNGVQDCPDDERDCSTTVSVTVGPTTIVPPIEKKCQEPVCPPGYKAVFTSKQNSANEATHNNNGKNGVKGSTKSRRPRPGVKGSRPAGMKVSGREVKCPEFFCQPVTHVTDVCPEPECPVGYKLVFERTSIFKPGQCQRYSCRPPPPVVAFCNVTGRTFDTFDGSEYKYDICNHILARDRDDNKWYITLEKQCSTLGDSCSRVLVVIIGDDIIILYPDLHVDINDKAYSRSQVTRLIHSNGAIEIARVGNSLHFTSNHYGFSVIWDRNSNARISATTKLTGHVDGLCGYFDGYPENDKQTPNGEIAKNTVHFGSSWVIEGTPECEPQVCPRLVQEVALKLCNAVNDRSLAICSGVLDTEKFVSRCLESACTCLRSNSTADDCRCQVLTTFVTECQAADQNADLSTWRTVHNCPVQCKAPFVHKDCFRNKCEQSCTNLQETDPCPVMDGVCFSGCFCPDGTVRKGDDCMLATECRDCLCDGFGNSKFVTFDRSNFTFNGNCTYILSRDISDKNIKGGHGEHVYQVLVTNMACDEGVCTEAITVLYQNHSVRVKRGQRLKELIVKVDDLPINQFPYKTSWLQLEEAPDRDITLLIPAIQLEVASLRHNFAFMVRLPSQTFGGGVEGLCGDCNGNSYDDFKKRNNEITKDAVEFSSSWLATDLPPILSLNESNCASELQEKCTPLPSHRDPCSKIFDTEKFGHCHKVIDPTPYILACQSTLCHGGNICDDFEAYARGCLQEGFCPDWRTSEVCPYKCPTYLEYHPCGPACKETCNNIANVTREKCPLNPMEGCFCPKDQILHNDTCISKNKCLVCDEEGHVEGDKWHPDKCTECLCHNKKVLCQRTECPAMETVCDEEFMAKLVTGREEECCAKYVCVPKPIVDTPCDEPQQLECGYGQIKKLTADINGCQKFICQCLPENECPSLESELISLDASPLVPGYVKVTNTSGCCPRLDVVCKPDTCPKALECPKYYRTREIQDPNSCCPRYECEPPSDICIYDVGSENELTTEKTTISKKIGEEWKDGLCKTCRCESSEIGPVAKCTRTVCPNVQNHFDINDYVLEEILLKDQCCPTYERLACKDGDGVYEVGDTWQPDSSNKCLTVQCNNETNIIQKQIKVQECGVTCDLGYEYKPSGDKSVKCCGECIAVACVINNELRRIDELWTSKDYCTNYSCKSIEGMLHIEATEKTCKEVDLTEEQEFQIEVREVPGECCPEIVRTACRSNGKLYKPGDKWISANDSCVTEFCMDGDYGAAKKQETKTCTKQCPVGWEYQEPPINECCGECKQQFCIVGDVLYEPSTTWYSDDNCTTFTCMEQNDQFIISSSSETCPDTSDCPLESIYNNGCCKLCKMITHNEITEDLTCTIKYMDLNKTKGFFVEKRGSHGLCKNLQPIEGIAECHGKCESSAYFSPVAWSFEASCQCCTPTTHDIITVELTCEDGMEVEKPLAVPTSCSCEACTSSKKPAKGRKTHAEEKLRGDVPYYW